MRRPVAVALTAVAATVAGCGGDRPTAAAPAARTAMVQRGPLSAAVSQDGTLTYRARSDGSPWAVVNRARGVYTRVPESGDEVRCGHVLYRVDDRPVLLLCGSVPAYRALRTGREGRDVRQLNRALHVGGRRFTTRTRDAVERLQRRRGMRATGSLALGQVVFLPGPIRVAKARGELGGPAQPGMTVFDASSATLHVRVELDPSQQGAVQRGDRAQITLPGEVPVRGRVEGFGRVAQAPSGSDAGAAGATVPVYLSLDDPARAHGFDQAPVGVDIATDGVKDALSVPITALVGRAGGGFAVEVVRPGGARARVAVTPGLFDTTAGRVEVDGALRAGDAVVVAAT